MSEVSPTALLQLENSELMALVDLEDFERLSKLKWKLARNKKGRMTCVYWCNSKCYGQWRLHNVILNRTPIRGGRPKDVVDHINRNVLDNRKENLRVASYRGNSVNAAYPVNKHGLRGVALGTKNKGKPWFASLRYHGYSVYLGSYATKEEAAGAYDIGAVRINKEFALINNVPINESTRLKVGKRIADTEKKLNIKF